MTMFEKNINDQKDLLEQFKKEAEVLGIVKSLQKYFGRHAYRNEQSEERKVLPPYIPMSMFKQFEEINAA